MKLSIFTPVFNRENTILRLYKSLQSQTVKNFEWIIVDDGSNDDSYELACSLAHEANDFSISVYRQVNSGKHVAINLGVQKAKGELFFIVDSDDYLSIDAVERVLDWFRDISSEKHFAGISALKAYENGEVVGGSFNNNDQYLDITNIDRAKYGLLGDRAEVYYTDILKKYPFPVFENENFISEAVVWNRIAHDKYKLRFVNDVIYYCEYLETGLSKNIQNVFLKNWKGYTFYVNQELMYRTQFVKKLSLLFAYVNLSKSKGVTFFAVRKNLTNASLHQLVVAYVFQPVYRSVIRKTKG